MPHLTADLGRFVAAIRYCELPDGVLTLVRDAFTDTVGVIMAGINEPVVKIVRKTLVEPSGRQESRACLSTHAVAAPDAALLGGTAAHALDYDDQSLSGHTSAVLVPAILAEADALGSDGPNMVTAYVAGYEVWAELLRRDTHYHKKGCHPTSVIGAIAAAAAVSVMRHLDAVHAATALAIAASHASGLAAKFGTMTKPYHAGLAARAGVVAARLAQAGMTAGADALESPVGFLNAYSPAVKPCDAGSAVRVGSEWYLLRQRLCIKKYASCYFMHRSFDTTVRMLAGRGLTAQDIDRIEVTMGAGQTTVLANHTPRTGLEAKFSEHFAMAAAVILRSLGVEVFTDAVVQRPDIQAFFQKVVLISVDEYDTRDPAHSPTERVVVHLVSGEKIDSGLIRSLKGHADDPMNRQELWEKFRLCTQATHDERDARQLFDILQDIDRLRSARDIPSCTRLFRT